MIRSALLIMFGVVLGIGISGAWGYGTPAYRWAHTLNPVIDFLDL